MVLSVNPSDILKLFSEKYYRDKESIVSYIESIAEAAASLAKVWELIRNDLAKGVCEISKHPELMLVLEQNLFVNASPFYRLQRFYENVSTVAEGRINKEREEDIVHCLGTLLRSRQITRETYEHALSRMRLSFFFDSENSIEDLRELSKAVDVLQREAAALDVLAKTIRASKKL